jgi:hypothetical protein
MPDDEYKEKMAPILADGFILNPPKFERIRLLTHLLYENSFAFNEMKTALAIRPAKFDGSNFHETFSHFYMAVVTHARCFVSAGKGISRLKAKHVFANEPGLKKFHELMDEFRNEVVAHTGHHISVRVTLAVKEEPEKYLIKHLVTPTMPSRNDLKGFLAVIAHTGKYIVDRVIRDSDHLGKELGKKIVLDK